MAETLDDKLKAIQQEGNHMTKKQSQIVEAAIELIAEKGYYNTSTSEIARRAGVAEGTIFRHYETKKDLLVAIVTPAIANFSAPFFAEKFVKEVFDESYQSFEDLLYAFIRNRFEFAQSNVPILKILLQELAFHPEIQTTYKQVFGTTVYPAMDHAFTYYKEKGEIGDLPTDVLIRMIVPTIIGFMIDRFMLNPQKDWDDELELRRTVEYILQGIRKNECQ
ncbi:TetR/AcrR family transcriptional regulator [Virgibacillus sp. LDC-1]|uniref:TetR/AcrR family transcriptional regulator n=1 Tax=Virgibacillus sp. LDC-1 TaxID=3039856 RepID=UPI0024DE1879|nr:TetR/AcrR family transcriptional regulator [Virgibacillus sp. LDC-1]